MLTRSLSLLLAAAIFGCPLVCAGGAGSCCERESIVARSCCCKHCHAKHDTGLADGSGPGDDSCPCNHDPSQKSCQGVCGGAVVEERDAQALTVEFTAILAPAMVALSYLQLSEPTEAGAQHVPLPDDGHNPGRMLRCLCQSFLI